MSATAIVVPDATCAPLTFRGTVSPANSAGSSAFGAFSYAHSVCNAGAVGPVTGSFAIDFGTDAFFGTLNGAVSATATPGVFSPNFIYTILGGTGRFLNASGSFSGLGTIDPRTPPARLNFAFAPVPEPATWLMLFAGFGALGWRFRSDASYRTKVRYASGRAELLA